MKYTLLQMTQDILSNLSSDEVNSISDNPESLQVATIIRQKYFDIINRLDLPKNTQLIQLNPSLDPTSPVLMYVPDGIAEIKTIKYFDSNPNPGIAFTNTALINNLINGISPLGTWATNSSTSNTIGTGTQTFSITSGLSIKAGDPFVAVANNSINTVEYGTVTSYSGSTLIVNVTSFKGAGTFTNWQISKNTAVTQTPPGYKYVTILPNDQYLDYVNSFNPSDFDVYTFMFQDTSNNYNGGFKFYYKNDHTPSYCTIISNYYVIFDSFDATQDSTLQTEKTMALGEVIPTFQLVDTFIPDLSEDQFQLLLNEAKALAFFELKQQPHQLADREVQRGWSAIQKKKAVANRPSFFDELPNFGRWPVYNWASSNDWNWKWR